MSEPSDWCRLVDRLRRQHQAAPTPRTEPNGDVRTSAVVNADTVLFSEAPDQRIWTICRVGMALAAMLHIALHVRAAVVNFVAAHTDESLLASEL